jgi:predicted HTH domain antitoxin
VSTEQNLNVLLPGFFTPLLNELPAGNNINDRVRVSIALGLLSAKKVSVARAAFLAGIPLADFIMVLKDNNIPWVEYTQEDLDMDRQTIRKLMQND